tara:strand:+ start:297 stop:1157 length:861 start_codon:yes stop_codon:yes gene_type:complete
MKKIIFLNNWSADTTGICYLGQTKDNSGEWGDIKVVTDLKEADYYIIMDGLSRDLDLDWSKVIYFQREPEVIKLPYLNHNFPDEILFNGTYKNFYNVVTWWLHSKSFNELVDLPYPTKSKKISTITSGKIGNNECRANRVKFLNRFIEKFPSIDVYGRGIKSHLHNKDCYKGAVRGDTRFCKFTGIIDYEYSVAMENTLEKNSWTEKACDVFLSWAIPIYSGASNFGEYFPEDSFLQIDITNPDIDFIIDFISQPPNKKQIEALREARNLILYKYNIWAVIDNILK